jgi:hypothetical protein
MILRFWGEDSKTESQIGTLHTRAIPEASVSSESLPGNQDYPQALASLEVHGLYYAWRVQHCESCEKTHRHGGGAVGTDDPRRLLGHRAAHCLGVRSGGYILVDANPVATALAVTAAESRALARAR